MMRGLRRANEDCRDCDRPRADFARERAQAILRMRSGRDIVSQIFTST
jgi:hypothetical protein